LSPGGDEVAADRLQECPEAPRGLPVHDRRHGMDFCRKPRV